MKPDHVTNHFLVKEWGLKPEHTNIWMDAYQDMEKSGIAYVKSEVFTTSSNQ